MLLSDLIIHATSKEEPEYEDQQFQLQYIFFIDLSLECYCYSQGADMFFFYVWKTMQKIYSISGFLKFFPANRAFSPNSSSILQKIKKAFVSLNCGHLDKQPLFNLYPNKKEFKKYVQYSVFRFFVV